jgi:hypothetical protein
MLRLAHFAAKRRYAPTTSVNDSRVSGNSLILLKRLYWHAGCKAPVVTAAPAVTKEEE